MMAGTGAGTHLSQVITEHVAGCDAEGAQPALDEEGCSQCDPVPGRRVETVELASERVHECCDGWTVLWPVSTTLLWLLCV